MLINLSNLKYIFLYLSLGFILLMPGCSPLHKKTTDKNYYNENKLIEQKEPVSVTDDGKKQLYKLKSDKPLSIDDVIALALIQNRQIQIALRNEKIAKDRIDQSFSEYLPSLELSSNYNYRNNDPGMKNPTTGAKNISGEKGTFASSVTASYVLTDFGGRSCRLNAAEIDKLIAKFVSLEEYQRITFEVTEFYFKVLQAKHFFDVAKKAVARCSKQVDISMDLFKNEIVAKNDVLSSEIRLAEAKQMLITAENNEILIRAALNFKLGIDIDNQTDIIDITEIPKFPLEYKRCLLMAIDNRPELKRLKSEKEKAKNNLKAKKAEFAPQIRAEGSYNYSSDEYRLNDSYLAAGIFLQWDFIKGGKVPAKIREAHRFIEQAEDFIKLQNDAIALEVKTAFLRCDENRKRIDVAKQAVNQADENLRIFEDQYKEALVSINEILIAQTLITKTNFDYYTALYDYHIAFARLENAIGTRILVKNK
ncbi:MAG: TolC family protein [Desulfobacterales bacterium]|nr:TolC family protein [Desulfobacterales bacterium]